MSWCVVWSGLVQSVSVVCCRSSALITTWQQCARCSCRPRVALSVDVTVWTPSTGYCATPHRLISYTRCYTSSAPHSLPSTTHRDATAATTLPVTSHSHSHSMHADARQTTHALTPTTHDASL